MPRKARNKSYDAIYHIMTRSISEVPLFRDNQDKEYYLSLLKRYLKKYKCCLYAYCLMDNHLHLHLDPKGFDISTFMHSLNTAYVKYYNKKHKRIGHLFQDRFQSKIVDTDKYNFALSAYIHNNAKDLKQYTDREEYYPFSSYGIYIGIRKDSLGIVDLTFMKSLINARSTKVFINRYHQFVKEQKDKSYYIALIKELEPNESNNSSSSGREIIIRKTPPEKLIAYISDRLNISKEKGVISKYMKQLLSYRSFTAYALRVLCGLSYREICSLMYNITISGCAILCNRGYEIIKKNTVYFDLFTELISIEKENKVAVVL